MTNNGNKHFFFLQKHNLLFQFFLTILFNLPSEQIRKFAPLSIIYYVTIEIHINKKHWEQE